MTFTVFGGKIGDSLVGDLKIKVFLKNSVAASALASMFPSSFTNEEGQAVYTQSVGSSKVKIDLPLISKVQLVSPRIAVISIVGVLFLISIGFIIAKLIK